MPKERLHMLLAEKARERLTQSGGWPVFTLSMRLAYRMGSMSPDTLFYDFPRFTTSRVGNALHRFQGEAGLQFFKSWLEEERLHLAPDVQAWMLGITSHFLVDSLWHPHINGLSHPPFTPCANLYLSPAHCHHWLESELEALWFSRLGPRNGFMPVLKDLQKKEGPVEGCLDHLRKFLLRAELDRVPSRPTIGHCFSWQTRLLRGFAQPCAARLKPWLLRSGTGRFLGALIVPKRSSLDRIAASAAPMNRHASTLLSDRFWDQTVTTVAGRLLELPVRF